MHGHHVRETALKEILYETCRLNVCAMDHQDEVKDACLHESRTLLDLSGWLHSRYKKTEHGEVIFKVHQLGIIGHFKSNDGKRYEMEFYDADYSEIGNCTMKYQTPTGNTEWCGNKSAKLSDFFTEKDREWVDHALSDLYDMWHAGVGLANIKSDKPKSAFSHKPRCKDCDAPRKPYNTCTNCDKGDYRN